MPTMDGLYWKCEMSNTVAGKIRSQVLKHLEAGSPLKLSSMAEKIRSENAQLSGIRDADVRAVVQPMIATGELSYASGLMIQLGKTQV